MSGAAGGSRINKEDLKATIRDYRDNILKPLGLDASYSITGVRSRPEKNIFGDIDIVVSFPEGDKKELKQQLANFLTQNDRIPIIPSKNKKYFIHGNIVSTLYPIAGKDGEYVQIDNIVTVSKEEGKFAYKMLDLPAQEQTLAIGLSKVIFTELDEKQIENLFKELGIINVEKPGEGEEYDFNLNPSELTLRIVPIGKSDGKLIWKSNKFEDVKKLTSALGIDIEKDKFDDIVPKIKKFKNRRSIDRLKGMFAKNIRVGDAEKEIEKGIKKQQALDTIASLEEKYNPLVAELIKPFLLEEESKIIAVFPGKFKPPHKDHIARIIAASKDADEVIVLVSPKTEPSGTTKKDKEKLIDQMPISIEDSLKIFKLANLPSNVKVMQSPIPSPVRAAYEMFENNPQQQFIAVFGKEEDLERFGEIPSNTVVKNYNNAAGNLSATDLRKALKSNSDISQFMPSNITPKEYKAALGLNTNEEMSQSDLTSVEAYADKELAPIDIDFTKHFFDRLNDPRNIKPISPAELIGFFKRLARKKDKLDDFFKQYKEIVATDNRTNINIPLVTLTDKIIAKTIMRKKDFYTPDPKLELNEDCGCQHSQLTDFKRVLASLTKYMLNQGLNINPLPKLKIINNDYKNAENILGKTAHYDPNNCLITLYTLNRHPKDILRSYAHEMIHRIQDNDGRLNNVTTTNTNEDGDLQELEKEAYLNGNMIFRNWEDSIKNAI
jgi:hypothetical protein